MRHAVVCLSLCLGLTGCAFGPAAPPSIVTGSAIRGSVFGGQQPYVLSRIFLFAASTAGYGSPSKSLLLPGPSTTLDADNLDGTYGDYYVLSGDDGTFNITGDYKCTPNTQVYLYAYGGRPAGPNILSNTGAEFLAALGNCPSSGDFQAAVPYIAVNEVSTVAAAYALAGFATDALHIASSGTPLAQTGIANAFANVTNLESISSGAALAATPAGNGIVPQTTINTLANILAACINTNDETSHPSTGVLSGQCSTLFSLATSDGTSNGRKPSDTANAAINIAHNPGANIGGLFALSSGFPPFGPALGIQPGDFTLGLTFPNVDGAIAIDASGSVWVTNNNNYGLDRLSSLGEVLSPPLGYPVDNYAGSIAIDGSGYIWLVLPLSGALDKFNNFGSMVSPPGGYKGGNCGVPPNVTPFNPFAIAIDGSANAWVANSYPGFVSEFSVSGSEVLPCAGYTAGSTTPASDVAIDGSGNVWTSTGNNSINEFSRLGSAISFTGGGLSNPASIALDGSGSVWVTNVNASSISKFSNLGTPISPSGYTGGGLDGPDNVAVDGAGNVWVTNGNTNGYTNNYTLSEFSNSGAALSPSSGYAGSYFGIYGSPTSIAIDGSGNVWISSGVSSSGPVATVPMLTEFIGIATPVITPIAAGLPAAPTADGSSNLGTRP